MRTDKDFALDELHERAYSIYDNKDDEVKALKELHHRAYMILDEEETTIHLLEYYDELDSLSFEAFDSLQQSLKTQDLFKIDLPNPQSNKREINSELCNTLSSLIILCLLIENKISSLIIRYKKESEIP